MAEDRNQRMRQKPEEGPFAVDLEYAPGEDAEDRLLTAYALLLDIPEAPEIDLEAQK
jgi:hypothetical protein